jgi:hypothetical protein
VNRILVFLTGSRLPLDAGVAAGLAGVALFGDAVAGATLAGAALADDTLAGAVLAGAVLAGAAVSGVALGPTPGCGRGGGNSGREGGRSFSGRRDILLTHLSRHDCQLWFGYYEMLESQVGGMGYLGRVLTSSASFL